MTLSNRVALAGVSLLAFAAPAYAQSAPTTAQPTVTNNSDIIIYARRTGERLQDVPKVVNAVNADDLRKNNIQKFDEISSIVPGISLQNAGNGETENATMRGVAFDGDTGLNPTVQFYLNEASITQEFVFQSMYDVGQIEVLRGPQGTLTGRSAPSGSITVTTKSPDLYKIGGYVQETAETAVAGTKEEGALNLPIIPGKLAVRFAGDVDSNEINNVRSVYSTLYPDKPYDRTWSERATVRAQPIDELDGTFSYQRLVTHELAYLQTESTCLIDPSVACGSGPLLSPASRLSTINGQRKVHQNQEVWNARLNLHLFGQKLSYVGQYAIENIIDEEPQDGANVFAGVANPDQKISGAYSNKYESHEVRLSSEQRIANILDYTLGYFTYYTSTQIYGGSGTEAAALAFLNGPYSYEGNNSQWEISWFGNVTLHPTSKLEVALGGRHITYKAIDPTGGGTRATDNVWSATASYHFTPTVMGYVNAASAFRPQGANLGFSFLPYQIGGVPLYSLYLPSSISPSLYLIQPEKSTSYEIGLKTQLMDRKLMINLDYYHQDFTNFQYVTPDDITVYLDSYYTTPTSNQNLVSPQIVLGTLNVPAKVDGVEGDINYHFAREGNIGGNFSYADGRVTGGGTVPCAGPVSAANPVALCPAGPTSFQPRFIATLHGDYAQPINEQVTGFVRGQMSYYGATPTNPGNAYDKQAAYALVNLYAGVRAPNSAWELTLFVKNLFNNQPRLDAYGGNIPAQTAQSGSNPTTVNAPYTYITTAAPREFGVTVRYAFGSR